VLLSRNETESFSFTTVHSTSQDMSCFVNKVVYSTVSSRLPMMRPRLASARTDRSTTRAARINKSVGYRSTRRSRRRPSHGEVDQDQPLDCLQSESCPYPEGAPREGFIGGRPSPIPLHYRRPSKCLCVFHLFPQRQNTASLFPASLVICSRYSILPTSARCIGYKLLCSRHILTTTPEQTFRRVFNCTHIALCMHGRHSASLLMTMVVSFCAYHIRVDINVTDPLTESHASTCTSTGEPLPSQITQMFVNAVKSR